MPRQGRVTVGQQAVGGEIARVGIHRLPALYQGALLKAEVIIDTRDAGAASGEVGIELQPGAEHGAVVIQLDGFLQVV